LLKAKNTYQFVGIAQEIRLYEALITKFRKIQFWGPMLLSITAMWRGQVDLPITTLLLLEMI